MEIIRAYDPDLIKELFIEIFSKSLGGIPDGIEQLIDERKTVAVEQDRELAGFGVQSTFEETGEDEQEAFMEQFGVLTPLGRIALRPILDSFQRKLGGKVVMEHHNTFPLPELTDYHFSIMGVRERFRRNGIGELLARERIKMARESGAERIYLQSYRGGKSFELYTKLGFTPIVTVGPAYADGSAATIMGFEL